MTRLGLKLTKCLLQLSFFLHFTYGVILSYVSFFFESDLAYAQHAERMEHTVLSA